MHIDVVICHCRDRPLSVPQEEICSCPQMSRFFSNGDVRLRDFIITPSANQIYGVDFETAYMGNYLEDLSGICCSIIDTDPGIFELSEPHHKITLINTFLKEYHKINSDFISVFNFEIFSELFIKQLNIVKKSRGMKSFHLHRESILDKIYDPTDSLSP